MRIPFRDPRKGPASPEESARELEAMVGRTRRGQRTRLGEQIGYEPVAVGGQGVVDEIEQLEHRAIREDR